MKTHHLEPQTATASFDLFRLSKSKQVVDISPNTLREFHRKGLTFYRRGRAVFVSKAELEFFIRNAGSYI
jgi:hypothetical protein